MLETELKMLETVYCFLVLKSELKECMYFETEHCLAAAAFTAVVTGFAETPSVTR